DLTPSRTLASRPWHIKADCSVALAIRRLTEGSETHFNERVLRPVARRPFGGRATRDGDCSLNFESRREQIDFEQRLTDPRIPELLPLTERVQSARDRGPVVANVESARQLEKDRPLPDDHMK